MPRLLFLFAIVAVGWPLAFFYASTPAPKPKKPTPAAAVKAPPPPDNSVAFKSLKDKTPMTFTENAAYAELIERARQTPAAELAARSYRNVPYTELWERPERYRGILIHLEGTARRVLVHDEINPGLAPRGRLYETYTFSYESQNNPYILVTEEMPENFPGGSDITERVAFDGYFFKLLAYRAGDTTRAAPTLIGHLHWQRYTQGNDENPGRSTLRWLFLGLSVLTIFSLARWAIYLRRVYVPRPRKGPSIAQPADTIEPEALSNWIEGSEGESDDPYGLRQKDEEP
ncbi:MAG TPA: hypothetical protein VGZ22_11125 [Isosphaeraceae bacterium]|nr:hypothetical protein [Isosphaeraceae bacterium]